MNLSIFDLDLVPKLSFWPVIWAGAGSYGLVRSFDRSPSSQIAQCYTFELGAIYMSKWLGMIFLLLGTLIGSPANSESSGTHLMMTAHWDNMEPIRGTVTLVRASVSKDIVAKPLSQGRAEVTVSLAENAFDTITLLETDGKELLKFPITTAMINPTNLSSAEIEIVCRLKDRSIASARINVLMAF
jgi:hypothetical protein